MKSKFTKKAEASLSKLIKRFENGDVAACCAIATFPSPDFPSSKWSLNNRWLAFAQTGQVDCRGFRQWEKIGRKVRKGSTAAFILRPKMFKVEVDGKEEMRLAGFGTVAVFPVDCTDGDDLDYEIPALPKLPLMDVAEKWGVKVSAHFANGNILGWTNTKDEIGLCTTEEKTFFHELCHVAHARLSEGGLKNGQDAKQEIIADLGAQVLSYFVGRGERDLSGNTFRYVKDYADKSGQNVLGACLAVLSETAEVIGSILDAASERSV